MRVGMGPPWTEGDCAEAPPSAGHPLNLILYMPLVCSRIRRKQSRLISSE